MKTSRYFFLACTALMLIFTKEECKAQSPSDAYFTSLPDGAGTVSGTLVVVLPDTQNIASIEVKLGSVEGQADLADYTFSYDVTAGLPTGYLWQREGMKVTLPLGTMAETDLQFGRVRLQFSNGNWGDTYSFVTN